MRAPCPMGALPIFLMHLPIKRIKQMIIAVDFDGTIVEHRYPEIGKEKPFAIATLKELQKEFVS